MNKLPEWFDWNEYESYIGNIDCGFWVHEFYTRCPDYKKDKEAGLIALYTQGPAANTVKTTWLWESGILSYGGNGHSTRMQMEYRVKQYADMNNARFISGSELQVIPKALNDSHLYTARGAMIVGGERGWLKFNNQEEFDGYCNRYDELFLSTVSLAFNIDMPEKVLVKQFEKIVRKYKQRRHNYKELKRKNISDDITRKWAIGLACWDLKHKGHCNNALIEKHLLPMLPKEGRGSKEDASTGHNKMDTGRKKVSRAIETANEQINGGWKNLLADPFARFNHSSKQKK